MNESVNEWMGDWVKMGHWWGGSGNKNLTIIDDPNREKSDCPQHITHKFSVELWEKT